ncbi:unnamed protein product [Cunninghamella blakesleeana]
MIHLPTEMIGTIFQYLLQKYIKVGSTICKEIFISILNTFPNFHCIQGVNIQSPPPSTNRVTFSPLNQLEHLFIWYQYYNEQWMKTLDKNQHNIKSLEFSIQNDLVIDHEQNQPITAPITHFTRMDTVLHEYNDVTSSITPTNYKMYTIKLPALPCLTHLSISWLFHKGNEQILEYIHQPCPQLKSLSLNIFNMHVSNNYNEKMINQLIKPNVYLKELRTGVKFNDPACFDYLSFKYPHLESISLVLGSIKCPKLLTSSFSIAIYKMITEYSYLKKLKVNLTHNLGEPCWWPHNELIAWLQRHPT